ncbi:hypothetical protein ASE74_10120 [Pedobacter sp. Leaf216]|uniref:hypothetical protein n=1 Tax=Pedobacter sp. Leaf216 TaxID=1735684 RepID=UPI0006FA59D3|nr:hypothetical protein [Pedobacter sp. Leaf216]KQM65217.1 hypothetical protein ASE74_10120 [Pedobacter sp. Leaf216]
MKKIKLSLDKLTVGSLTEAEERKIMGGENESAGSQLVLNHVCVGSTSPAITTNIINGCTVTVPPTISCKTGIMNSCL